MRQKLKKAVRVCREHLDDTHHALHLTYLGAVYLESHYYYAKIAGGLFVVTLLATLHERSKRRHK